MQDAKTIAYLVKRYLSSLLAFHQLDERFENATNEIEAFAGGSESCRQLSVMARSKCAPFKAVYRRMIRIKTALCPCFCN
jgi:hypothetical protein